MVDQTVRATRLVIDFFKQHGDCSLQELLTESGQLDALEEEVARDLSSVLTEEQKELKSKEMAEMVRFLTRQRGEEVDVADSAARCLIEAGLSVSILQRFYQIELAEGEEWACRAMRRHLLSTLKPLRMHPGNYVDLHTVVAAIMDYIDTRNLFADATSTTQNKTQMEKARGAPVWYQCSLCHQQGAHWMVECPTAEGKFDGVNPAEMEESYLKDNLAKVEAAMQQKRYGDCISVSSSLQAIQCNIYRKIVDEVVAFGGKSEQAAMVASIAHKVLSLLRLSHFSLKSEFDSSQASFRKILRARLMGLALSSGFGLGAVGTWKTFKESDLGKSDVHFLLPHGVGVDTLVNWVAEYFEEFSNHGGFKIGQAIDK